MRTSIGTLLLLIVTVNVSRFVPPDNAQERGRSSWAGAWSHTTGDVLRHFIVIVLSGDVALGMCAQSLGIDG